MEGDQLIAHLETILAKLLVSDTVIIQQGTSELKETLKHPHVAEALCSISTRSVEAGTRQHATTILRRMVTKKKKWMKLQPASRDNIKRMLIEGLMAEKEQIVFTALTYLVGVIASYELTANTWPDLLHLVNSQISSNDANQRQAGFLTLSSLSDMATEELMPHFNSLLPFLSTALTESSPCAFYAVETVSHFVPFVGSDHVRGVQELVPALLKAAKYLVVVDDDKGIEALDVFDVLMESELSIIAPYMKAVLELCLEIARNEELSDGVRSKALSTVQYAVRLKKKVIVKQKLIEPILGVVLQLMCIPGEDDEDGDDDDDETSPRSCASQTLDSMAMNLPPDKVITPTVEWVRLKIVSPSIPERRAALTAIAVICEGAADHVMNRHLETFLKWVCPAIRDPVQGVRNDALFALGQMSEHLQPNITKYSNELLPVLFDLLTGVHQELKKGSEVPPGTDRIFYALEMFCEKLEEKLTPFLPPLVQTLLSLLDEKVSYKVQALALSALEATAISCKEDLTPFFDQILGHLQRYLQIQNEPESEEEANLLLQTLGTLGTMARTMKESFKPIALEVLQMAIMLVECRDDADLRKCCYSVFGAISTVLDKDMESYMNRIIPPMLTALRRYEEDHKLNGTADPASVDILGELSDSDDSDDLEELESGDEEDDEDEITVYNAALEEKEEACDALKEIAKSLGPLFMPFIKECSSDVFPLIGDLYEDIRKSAIEASTEFTITLHKNCPENVDVVEGSITTLLPRFVEVIQTDPEPTVVMAALDGVAELLKQVGAITLCQPEFLPKITESVTMILRGKSKCQLDVADDAEGESEDEGPEQEALLFEYAGEVVPALITAVCPHNEVVPNIVDTFVPLLEKKARKSCSEGERSFSAGCLAEVVRELKDSVTPWADKFLQLFLATLNDKNDEVRSNSAYGIGLLAYHTKSNFEVILKALSESLSKESAPRGIDNICAAVARMLLADSSSIPVDKVLPVLVSHLPMKEDLEEIEVVYECLSKMYDEGHPVMLSLLPQIVHATSQAATSKKIDEDSRNAMRTTMLKLSTTYPTEFNQSLTFLPPELKSLLHSLVS